MSSDGGETPARVDCPWCAEPISARALVCRHCRRDVALPMPLLLAQRDQAKQLAALQREVQDLRAELALSQVDAAGRAGLPAVQGPGAPAAPGTPRGPVAALAVAALPVAAGVAATLALLVGVHWLLIIRYDTAAAALRTACIVISLGIALATPGLWRMRAGGVLGLGALIGVAAVLGMSWNVARADGVPVLPATARDLFEMLEFAASIGFSFAAGGLILGLVQRARTRSLRLAALESVRDRIGAQDIKAIGERADALKKIMDFGAPVAALCGALATGFRSLIGGP